MVIIAPLLASGGCGKLGFLGQLHVNARYGTLNNCPSSLEGNRA